MKVEIVSRETIRPASPTPDHLKCFSFSIFDQFSPAIYTPVILFYRGTGGFSMEEASDRMRTSLVEALTLFYPFTGRIRDNIRVDCNDEGVEYLKARISGTSLRDILTLPEPEALQQLLPIDIMSAEAYSGQLLLVQETVFDCGGMAIGICISHKLADAATLSSFLKTWSASARGGSGEPLVLPNFSIASVFPPSDLFTTNHPFELPDLKCFSRRYGFSRSKIAALRAKSRSETVHCPTRIEAVCALIWKCAMRASQSKNESPRSSVLAQTVNLRKRVDPPLPDSSVGNLLGFYTARTDEPDRNDLPVLVAKMRNAMEEYTRSYTTKLREPDSFNKICEATEQGGNLVKEDGYTLYIFTSWCKFELYGADFGWGKPDWTSICSSSFKNTTVLMDARDGEGIEAWVTLPQDDMVLFEQDQELLSFASHNPNVLLGQGATEQ